MTTEKFRSLVLTFVPCKISCQAVSFSDRFKGKIHDDGVYCDDVVNLTALFVTFFRMENRKILFHYASIYFFN